jgi:hypothetical protein
VVAADRPRPGAARQLDGHRARRCGIGLGPEAARRLSDHRGRTCGIGVGPAAAHRLSAPSGRCGIGRSLLDFPPSPFIPNRSDSPGETRATAQVWSIAAHGAASRRVARSVRADPPGHARWSCRPAAVASGHRAWPGGARVGRRRHGESGEQGESDRHNRRPGSGAERSCGTESRGDGPPWRDGGGFA